PPGPACRRDRAHRGAWRRRPGSAPPAATPAARRWDRTSTCAAGPRAAAAPRARPTAVGDRAEAWAGTASWERDGVARRPRESYGVGGRDASKRPVAPREPARVLRRPITGPPARAAPPAGGPRTSQAAVVRG